MAAPIWYSNIYRDDEYEFRHVILPRSYHVCRTHLLPEAEWRALGITMGEGWQNYTLAHRSEPHVLLFRRRYARPRRDASTQTEVM